MFKEYKENKHTAKAKEGSRASRSQFAIEGVVSDSQETPSWEDTLGDEDSHNRNWML